MAQKILGKLAVLGIFLTCFLGVRLHHLFGGGWVEKLIGATWLMAGVLGFAAALSREPKPVLLMILAFAAPFVHSYAKLFQPSLAADIPELDYLFFESVSSNYCFDLAKKYTLNLAVAFFAFHGFFTANLDDEERSLKFLVKICTLVLSLNLAVVAVQGWGDLNFLSNGSGTAIAAGRAPGLLEDSGASTVVLSASLIFLLAWLVEAQISPLRRLLACIGWTGAAYIGTLTGGRSYLSLLLLGVVVLLGLKSLQFRWKVKKYWLFAASMIGLIAAGYFYQRVAAGIGNLSAFEHDPWLARAMAWFDPIRGIHSAILLKSIPEYWPEGTGLGGSHIAIAQFKSQFDSRGFPVMGDAPLNFYLGFLTETGMGGAVILLSIAMLTAQKWLSARDDHKSRRVLLPMIVLLIGLVISGLVGSHNIFRSFACLLAMPLAYVYAVPKGTKWPALRIILSAAVVFVFLIMTSLQFLNLPLVPEFYWARQGKPQLPLGYNVPIASPQKSQWMAPGVPFAVNTREIEFFVEMPPEYYPIQVSVYLYLATRNELLQKHSFEPIAYDAASPGKVLSLELSAEAQEYCTRNFTPTEYCYARIYTEPSWALSKDIVLGFSLMKPRAN